MRVDSNGLIVGFNDGCQGDTCFFMAHYHYCSNLLNKSEPDVASYAKTVDLLWDEKNLALRRGTDKTQWYGATSLNSSRDQHIGHIICMGKDMFNDPSHLTKIFFRLIFHFGFFPNILKNYTNEPKQWTKLEFPDIAGPDCAGNFVRSYNCRILWPTLIIGDCFLALAVIYRLFHVRFIDTEDYDDANTNISLMQAKRVMPTPISWLARKLWKFFRFRGLDYANNMYFSAKRNSAVGLEELWNEVIAREF